MYALLIGVDGESAADDLVPPLLDRYLAIRETLERRGFREQSPNLFFGDARTTAIHCVLAVQELQCAHDWFQSSTRRIRMLRIEEVTDLLAALA
jgi:virulence-associated protein VapD